jgi:hypothetical protein
MLGPSIKGGCEVPRLFQTNCIKHNPSVRSNQFSRKEAEEEFR